MPRLKSRQPSFAQRQRRRQQSRRQQANADGLRMLKEANPDNAVLQIKSLEAFAKAADGKATKIIIPSEIQGIAGLTKSIAEIAADKTEK